MRTWLLVLSFFLSAIAGRALDFGDDVAPIFNFHETYEDSVIGDPDFPGDFIVRPHGTVIVNAIASIKGADLDAIDLSTQFDLAVGDFDFGGDLSLDEFYTPGDTSAVILIEGIDANGDSVTPGQLTLNWGNGKVNFGFQVTDQTDDFTVAASDYYPDVEEDNIDRDDLIASVDFGPYSLDFRTVYTTGKAELKDPDPRVSDNLSKVLIDGAIDNIPPSIVITSPTAGQVLTTEDSPDGLFTITGTVTDTRMVKTDTFAGAVESVEVQLGDKPNVGPFVLATLDNNGNWSLPNAQLTIGPNNVTVRATDQDGNIRTLQARAFTYQQKGNVTVTAAATGYAPGDTGKVAGTVSGSFLKVGSRTITMVVGQAAPTDTKIQNSGTLLTVVAKPGVGSVFNGWVGTINGTPVMNEVTETLRFSARPNLILTANFVPNPFTTAITGKYLGLMTGTTVAERGTAQVVLTKTGAFTGLFKVGALVLPVKGKVLGSGLWSGTVKKLGKTYQVTLNLTMGVNGDRQITGTVTGNGLNSSFSTDLNAWKSKTNEATAYMASYNLLLPADTNNTNPNFPQGIGYGRVTIGKLGTVKFVGKLGDSSVVTASSLLIKRNTGAVVFPIYIGLDKKLGAVSGTITYDSAQTTTDLTGNLDWQEPATTGVHPLAFNGKIALEGSRYTKPVGTRVILNATSGHGTMSMVAPLFTKPTNIQPTPLSLVSFPVVLNLTTNAIETTSASSVTMVNLKFNASTGLFAGTFHDVGMNKTLAFAGAASQKANKAAGVFIRGNQAGSVKVEP